MIPYILGPLTGGIFAGVFMRFVAVNVPIGGPNPLKPVYNKAKSINQSGSLVEPNLS